MNDPIVVATRSAHKLSEIRAIMREENGPEVIDLDEAGVAYDPREEEIEVYSTFRENALAKARYFCERTGRVTLADDSGLCVEALDGAPGVYSKRFSGRNDLSGAALDTANNQHLLHRLRDVPAEQRQAHYRCVLALVTPQGEEQIFEGRCNGMILPEPRGQGGFGYDPLFLSHDLNASFGEVDAEEKNRISHRSRALREFARGHQREPAE